ncbi:MBL fold metallo-hydrolase [Rhodobacterales bacterium]|nr:MBL fold metallo-hydrolase [Rhodobacterales bacterium]
MSSQVRAGLSRRSFLTGAVALSASGTVAMPRRSLAAAEFAFGAGQIRVFSDGHLTLPMGFVLPEQSAEEIAALLEPNGLATDVLTPDCNVTLMRSGDRLVLFDVGAGPNFQPTAGALAGALDDAGIDTADITDVVFTHGHPDHLWGVLDDFGDPLFPEATYRVPQAEWDYWLADETLSQTPDDRKNLVVGAQTRFETISDQVVMIRPGQEVLPGVEAVDTAGHTPGHMSYAIHDGSESLMIIGDAIPNSIISFQKPGWPYGPDQDQDMAIETRKRLLDRLATDGSRVIGNHFPHPAKGRVERATEGYRLVTG